jgi:uroporphyrinogen III methyltransferase/synthase
LPSIQQRGIVYLVGAGPGDPGLITLRGLERLKQADVVIYDRLANHSLLAHASQAELIDVGKRPNHHRVPQEEITVLLIEKAGQNKVVVRLKGGDPFVFGRGGEEALALAEAGIPFEIVPGITSAIAAPAYAGIPITHRGLSCSAALATGHRAEFVEDPTCDWAQLACGPDTLVFLMGVHNLPQIVEQLVAHGRSTDTPVALVERASRTSQKTAVGTLANIVQRAAEIRPPAAVIIGDVVQLRQSLRWFDRPDRHPLLGLRVLNTRPLDQAGSLSRRLMELGAEPVELPTTQIVAAPHPAELDAAINALAGPEAAATSAGQQGWDWIIFTSANGVTFFIDRLLELGQDVRRLAGVKLLVVGRATIKALRQYGLTPDLVPSRYTSQSILADIGPVAGQRMLLPTSNLATPDLIARVLRDQGALIETVAAYSILPVEPHPVSLATLLDGGVDVVTFVSPTAVEGLVKMLDGHLIPDNLLPLPVACIGPATADVARSFGMQVDVVPEQHTVEGLLQALVTWHTANSR